MKKNDVLNGKVEQLVYPSSGIVYCEGHGVSVKGALVGQEVEFRLSKNRDTAKEGKLLEVLTRADYEIASFCEHFGSCGGCARQTVPYTKQTQMKLEAVQTLFEQSQVKGVQGQPFVLSGVIESPLKYEYRNKMEYSFGNEQKGGILNLGMHKKGRFYDVVSIPQCHLVDSDFRNIVNTMETLARQQEWTYFNRNNGSGLLRHAVVRKSPKTGEILVGISTSSSALFDGALLVSTLLDLKLDGTLVGIVHLINDESGDVVKPGPLDRVLYGRDYYIERLFNLEFKVSFFSFFQTNTLGAELLYQSALNLLNDSGPKEGAINQSLNGQVVFDLFSGTGTIAQVVAAQAKKVIGIEIVADAVAAAKQNALDNGLNNCEFIAGDVFQVLENLPTKPDMIIVDPPRGGMTPKTVAKIASYGVPQLLYISCNPKTMAENLVQLAESGYYPQKGHLVDLYPHTDHVEAVCLLAKI